MIKKILLADDHGIVRIGLSITIKKILPQVEIHEADNFKSVLDIINKTKFDLVILDINMPDGNFQQTFDIIKIKQPGVKVLVFSSQDEKTYAIRYLKLGADGFLPKMSDDVTLKKALEKMFEKGSYVSQDIQDTLISDSLNKSRPATQNPLTSLSDRELEIADKLIDGKSMKEISNELNLHISTASTYKTRLFKKLDVKSIPELIDIVKFYAHLIK